MMLTFYLRRMVLTVLALSLIYAGGGLLVAGNAAGEPVVEVRIGPPRQVVGNAMGIARQVRPGFQTELLPALFLGALGYPQFSDFDPSAPIHMLAFVDDQQPDGVKWVGVAALREGSNPLRWLRARGMTVEFVDGWALFYSSAPSAAERKVVLARADAVASGDIAWTIRPNRMAVDGMRERILTALRLKMSGSSQAACVEPAVDVLFESMDGLDSLTMGLDLAAGAVELSMRLSPAEGSVLHDLLQRPRSTADDGSRSIGSGGLFEFRGRMPQQTCLLLTEWMLEFGTELPGVAAALESTSVETLLDLAARLDGTGSGVMAFHSDGELRDSTIAYAADFSFDDLVAWRELQLIREPQWAARLQATTGESMVQRELTTGEVDGQPFLRFETAVHKRVLAVDSADYLAATEALRSGQRDPELLAAFGEVEEGTVRIVSYETVVNGSVVVADSQASMVELARRVANGEAVDNNLGAALPMGADDLFVMRTDVGKLPLVNWVMAPTPTTERMIRQFRATKHQPLEFRVRDDGGILTMAVNLPVSSLTAVSRLRNSLEQSANAEGQQVRRIPF